MTQNNNSKIAKNTLLLYIRMLLTMLVSLYTSRVVLNTLGVEDFGIYNVVGGVVVMLAFLSSALSSGTQRFLSFELGRKDYSQLTKVFSMSVTIHLLLALLIFVLAESIGPWFIDAYLTIPHHRLEAAHWVFHASVLSFIVSVINVPYNASIISHERMNIYAYVSIVEVVLKLLVVFLLQLFLFDKLKLYSILILVVSIIIPAFYIIYCVRHFVECKYRYFWDKSLFKTLSSYACWSLFGNLAAVTYTQGINILLNIFFGPTVNAARGIAYQVNSAVTGFITNFQLAMKPQIIKSYAQNEKEYMMKMLFRGSKYSFFLLYILCLPILLETNNVLLWWLKIVPDYAPIFCRLVLICALIESLSGTLITAAQATGTIKIYQSVVGGLLLLILPISYLLLKAGLPPYSVFIVNITVSFVAFIARLLILRKLILLPLSTFVKSVLWRILIVVLPSLILPFIILYNMEASVTRFIIITLITVISLLILVYCLGLKTEEKEFINSKVNAFLIKMKDK